MDRLPPEPLPEAQQHVSMVEGIENADKVNSINLQTEFSRATAMAGADTGRPAEFLSVVEE